MKICNCHQDLDALLCDIPLEWREGIVKSLCAVYGELNQPTCDELRNCQTLTNLSPFTLIENNLSIKYKDEKGQIKTRSIDLTPIFDSVLDGVDPMCLTTPEDWASMSHTERMSLIYSEMCVCCPPTTTTTTTTTTSSTTTTTTIAPNCISYQVTSEGSSEIQYTDCEGTPVTDTITDETIQFCAYEGSIVIVSGSPLIEILDVCTGGTTSTSTTTTSSTTTTTTLEPNLFWIPFATECESSNGFEVDKLITGLSSPLKTWYDAVNELVYVADQDDDVNGNVYWFNPVTATTAGDMVHTPAIMDNELYNASIDSTYRRIYFVGKDSGGLLVYDIDTNSTSVVSFGTNGIPFNRVGLTVAPNYIYCTLGNASTTTNIVIINRSVLTIAFNHLTSSLPTPTQFTGGSFTLTPVGSEIWVASSNSSFPDVGVYSGDLLTRHTGIVLPSAATWDFGKYHQGLFFDETKNRVYATEIGSSRRHVINATTRTVIDTRVNDNEGGKSNSGLSWSINPITNELVASFIALNTGSDATPIKRTYIVNRDTYDYINMFEGQYYINLQPITGTNTLVGSDPGAPFWIDPVNYDTDGSISIISSSIGVDNNGTLIVLTLQEIDGNNGNTPTGNYKNNILGDPDYIPPYFNSSNCPIITNLNCPTSAMTTFASGTLNYEFSISASVKNNPLVDNIAVYAYNTGSSLRDGLPIVISDPTVSNYYSGSFSSLLGPSYTVEIVYRDNTNAELENCFVS